VVDEGNSVEELLTPPLRNEVPFITNRHEALSRDGQPYILSISLLMI
jgi:hypothetical protein